MSKGQIILALNVGSTSVKSRVFAFNNQSPKEIFCWSKSDIDPQGGHKKVFAELYRALKKEGLLEKITAVGHRVVHGGPMKKSVKIGSKEVDLIRKFSDLAPLHNPYNLEGIREAKAWFGKSVAQVAVFDTAFYSTLPQHASIYAIPENFSKKFGLYRYGFHGISHNYSLIIAAKILKKPINKINLITVHLGGGCSMTAIKNGVAVDTSMGFTPLEGLVMGTRSGDIDPGIIFHLAEKEKITLSKIKDILVHQSGILGLSGANNMLELLNKVKNKNRKAKLAFDIFVYRMQKYIGAYFAILGSCDAIVFTGAVGAGVPVTRNSVVRPFKKNILKKTKILAVKPNEEEMIALETMEIVG